MCFDLSTFSIIKIWNIDKHKLISAAALYSDNDSDLFCLRYINQSVIVLMCLLLCLSDRLTASQTAFFCSRHGGIYKSRRVLYLLRNHAHFTQRLLSLDTMNVFKEPLYWLTESRVNGRKKTRSCWRPPASHQISILSEAHWGLYFVWTDQRWRMIVAQFEINKWRRLLILYPAYKASTGRLVLELGKLFQSLNNNRRVDGDRSCVIYEPDRSVDVQQLICDAFKYFCITLQI